jgi:acyl carrier protein
VTLRVRRIVAEKLAVDDGRVYPSSRFVDDLAAD